MSVKVELMVPGGNRQYQASPLRSIPEGRQQVVATESELFGVFRATKVTTASTTVVVSAPTGGRIQLTDLMLTTDKTAGSSVEVTFEDGTNTVSIILADSANAPVNLAIGFVGSFEGWVNARIEMITVNNVTATLTLGYLKLKGGLGFAEWDGRR